MATKTWTKTDKKGREEEWSWEETPAVTKALKEYWAQAKANEVV